MRERESSSADLLLKWYSSPAWAQAEAWSTIQDGRNSHMDGRGQALRPASAASEDALAGSWIISKGVAGIWTTTPYGSGCPKQQLNSFQRYAHPWGGTPKSFVRAHPCPRQNLKSVHSYASVSARGLVKAQPQRFMWGCTCSSVDHTAPEAGASWLAQEITSLPLIWLLDFTSYSD